jgi:fucose 4-O-acetylase-like acetyltransferase
MVAFCHSINTDFESVDRWFQLTYLVLNMIMMPAFMFVSGIVLALSTKTVRDFKEYVSLSLKRTERLLVPYILFALTVFAGKLLLQHFSGLEKPVSADDFLSI